MRPRPTTHFDRSLFKWLGLAFLLVALSFGSASAQNGLINVWARDSLVRGEINGLPVQQLIGHVQFVQGQLYGSADRAIQYTTANRIELLGNVAIHQDTLSLYAPKVTYEGTGGIGHAEGGVKLTDRDITLTAVSGDYDVLNQAAYFHSNVLVTQGKTTSHSDQLTYYRATQTTILVGNAVVTSDSGSISANRITNAKALGETIAEGGVKLRNDSVQLNSDWLYNSQPLGELLARGRVSVADQKGHTILFGDTLARYALQHYTIVPKNPLLLSIDSSVVYDSVVGRDTTRLDTMFVKSRVMEIYQGDSARFIATDSVKVLRSDFSAIGGKLLYDQSKEFMTFSQASRQRLWYDSTEVDADSVTMLVPGRHVNRIFAIGNAFATSPVSEMPQSGRIDQLQGERMMLVVERDTVRHLFDMSNALSIYFRVTGNKPEGVNRASGDTIRIDFQNRAVSRLAVISGTEGEYFPERFVTGRAQAFRLSAFERNLPLMPIRSNFEIPWLMPRPELPPLTPTPSTPRKKRT